MKHNWEYKKLGEVCEIVGGSTPKTEIADYWNGDLNWFTPAELTNEKYYRTSERKITELAVKSTGLTLMPPGTVLLTSRAPIGKVGITTCYSYCNQGFKNLICKENLFNEYLYYTLIYFNEEIKDKGRGATFKEISKKVTESISIPVPPLSVQEQIVGELDKINELIDDCRELLRTLDNLAQSIFYDTFGDPISNPKGWEVKALKEAVIEMFLGPFGSALKTDCYVEENHAFAMVYEQKHAIKKTLDLKNNFIDKDKFLSLKRFEVLPFDFIMSCRGTIGQLYQIPENSPRGIIHPSLMKIRLNKSTYIDSFFLYMLPIIIKEQQTKGNCVQMAITAKELCAKKLPVPPLTLQEEFAKRIEAIEAIKATTQQQLAAMQTLLDSRMDYWFN